jgi:predicted MFS family arabinose efflux permease
MLDLTLFRNRTYVGANLGVLLVALAMFGVFFFVSLYLQTILGYSPVEAGAAFLPMTLLIIVIAPLAGRLADRVGSRWLMVTGMVLLSVHLTLFARVDESTGYAALLPAMVVGGVGIALVMTPASAAAMKAVPVDRAGVGSAVLNAFRQVGGSVGIALMGAIVAAQLGASRSPAAFLDGMHNAVLVAAAIALAGALVSGLLVRDHPARHAPSAHER